MGADFSSRSLLNYVVVVCCFSSCTGASPVTVEPLPAQTDAFTLLVHGQAPAQRVVSIYGAAGKVSVLSDETGAFVAPVALTPASDNILSAGLDGEDSAHTPPQTVTQVLPDVRELALTAGDKPLLTLDSDPAVDNGIATLSGHTAVNARVVISGGQTDIMVAADDAGAFVAYVPLRRSADCLLELTALDARSGRSEPRRVLVSQTLETLAPPAAPSLDQTALSIDVSTVSIRGSAAPGQRVRIEENGATLAEGYAGAGGKFTIGLSVSPGTHALDVRSVIGDDSVSAAVAVTVKRKPPKAKTQATQYPIVLVHGMGGFNDILGYKYFFGIEDDYRQLGYEVYTVEMTPIATPETRARQLKEQILSFTNGKVNLVAHSQGTLDSRYMISSLDMADHVASLTSIAGPHRGSRVADVALGLTAGPAAVALDILLRVLHWEWAAVQALSEKTMQNEFNPNVLDDARVYYQSYTGAADPFGIFTGTAISAIFVGSWAILDTPDSGGNDGLVTRASGTWGHYRGELPADHLTEIGQVLGLLGHFDYLAFYEDIAADLVARGY